MREQWPQSQLQVWLGGRGAGGWGGWMRRPEGDTAGTWVPTDVGTVHTWAQLHTALPTRVRNAVVGRKSGIEPSSSAEYNYGLPASVGGVRFPAQPIPSKFLVFLLNIRSTQKEVRISPAGAIQAAHSFSSSHWQYIEYCPRCLLVIQPAESSDFSQCPFGIEDAGHAHNWQQFLRPYSEDVEYARPESRQFMYNRREKCDPRQSHDRSSCEPMVPTRWPATPFQPVERYDDRKEPRIYEGLDRNVEVFDGVMGILVGGGMVTLTIGDYISVESMHIPKGSLLDGIVPGGLVMGWMWGYLHRRPVLAVRPLVGFAGFGIPIAALAGCGMGFEGETSWVGGGAPILSWRVHSFTQCLGEWIGCHSIVSITNLRSFANPRKSAEIPLLLQSHGLTAAVPIAWWSGLERNTPVLPLPLTMQSPNSTTGLQRGSHRLVTSLDANGQELPPSWRDTGYKTTPPRSGVPSPGPLGFRLNGALRLLPARSLQMGVLFGGQMVAHTFGDHISVETLHIRKGAPLDKIIDVGLTVGWVGGCIYRWPALIAPPMVVVLSSYAIPMAAFGVLEWASREKLPAGWKWHQPARLAWRRGTFGFVRNPAPETTVWRNAQNCDRTRFNWKGVSFGGAQHSAALCGTIGGAGGAALGGWPFAVEHARRALTGFRLSGALRVLRTQSFRAGVIPGGGVLLTLGQHFKLHLRSSASSNRFPRLSLHPHLFPDNVA
ncbi:hypothetical protein FB45DRAFT_872994 [Roridomyces roridus]|uniref:Uncharacterized protein n=1 Tax=Roridomyces roridus TaxID=1738132 RepID=A0AAD7BBL7_9AGAR|nr:hypothetical protein FB45DRAFT_872994 [Roridomyces roridus]